MRGDQAKHDDDACREDRQCGDLRPGPFEMNDSAADLSSQGNHQNTQPFEAFRIVGAQQEPLVAGIANFQGYVEHHPRDGWTGLRLGFKICGRFEQFVLGVFRVL